ncbi:hypothetical protein Tco_1080721 [Tanacetum coccineum]|uniref:Transposase (putative) gypsy type domain-containing protein n=1 Tax=Tanacetum coccineum TaxID=301880 RepID=A0ABQ5HVK5_9ASTR
MWPRPRGLVHSVYVTKSPPSSMILPADHVLRAVINARLSATLFLSGVIYFYAVPLLGKWHTRGVIQASVSIYLSLFFKMANKHSIMTREMVESFCNSYYIPDEVHPTAPGRDVTITQFPEGKVGVYTRLFDYCGYRIPLTKFFIAVLKHFRIHISQLSPFGAARISHFEVLTRVLDLAPTVAVFRIPYLRSFVYGRRVGEGSGSPSYARQEQTVQVLSANKAPFWRYPECFLALVGLSLYYPFNENTYPAFERPDKTDMGLLDYIRTADPRKVQAVEVQKGEEQVKLLDSIKHCFVSLDAPAVVQQEGCSGSGAGPDVSAPSAEENVVAEENVIPAGTYLDLIYPKGDMAEAEKGDAARKQPDKVKRKKLSKQSDTLPAKRLRVDHPSLASGTGEKSLASLRRTIPEGSLALGPTSQAVVHAKVTVQGSHVADAPVYTAAAAVTSSRGKMHVASMSDMGGSSQLETSEGSADSFYETAALNSEDAKRWYIPRWNITNDSLLDDGFSYRTLICLGSEVRSRTEHELELKEKLRVKYDARGVLLKEKDVEIARLKSLVKEKETESTEVSRLHNQVSVLTAEKSSLSAEVSVLKSVVSQKETDISLLDSRTTYLKSSLDDSQDACDEARNLISSLSSERDGLASEVSTLHSAFHDFKEKMEAQQEAQAQVLYNRMAELEAHVMDVSGLLEGEFYPTYLTALAGRRWLLTYRMELAMVKCLKSPEYQGILGHALGRAMDYGMQEGLAAGHEHGVARTPLSVVMAYNPEAAKAHYLDAVRALEEADFSLVQLLKSKKDSRIDELSVPIYHADIKTVVGETSLSFALLNVHTRAEGARKHAAALRQLMVDIISHPLSSQNLIGEASTSAATFFVEDLDTDEDLGSVVCMPQFEDLHFEIFP